MAKKLIIGTSTYKKNDGSQGMNFTEIGIIVEKDGKQSVSLDMQFLSPSFIALLDKCGRITESGKVWASISEQDTKYNKIETKQTTATTPDAMGDCPF